MFDGSAPHEAGRSATSGRILKRAWMVMAVSRGQRLHGSVRRTGFM